MLIGLDLMYLAPGATGGMETYARALIPEIAKQRPEASWVIFCGRELAAELREAPWCDRLIISELPVSSNTRFRRVAIEQTLLPLRIRRAKVDLVHSLGNTAPLAPGKTPIVLTIMDLIWARLPETHSGILARGLSFLVPRAARRADRLIAPSQATATDLTNFLGIPHDRISVVPLGPGLRDALPTPEAELRTRLGLGDGRLILCPAPRRAHKNVRRLVEAVQDLDVTLVVPGYASREGEINQQRRYVPLGWISDADMEGLYRASTLLVYPSLAEGFGLPVLEAMRRGVPVACSNVTSLPEVAGDAAIQFDPLAVGAIRSAIKEVLDNDALRRDLVMKGLKQANLFSWKETARGTLKVYDRCLLPPS